MLIYIAISGYLGLIFYLILFFKFHISTCNYKITHFLFQVASFSLLSMFPYVPNSSQNYVNLFSWNNNTMEYAIVNIKDHFTL